MYDVTEISLTPQTYKRLEEELEDLTTRGRIEIAAAIEAARALGDLKENGDYHAAKDSQGKMEARIRQIQHILANAILVEEGEDADSIAPGSVVHLRYEGDDQSERYLIGSIEEQQRGMSIISPASPLGQAIIGKGEGQTVEYQSPAGVLRVEIVKIGS